MENNIKKICIVIPTYNEAGNVRVLLPMIFEQYSGIPTHRLHVLIVDDKSPDGTADIIRMMQQKYPTLHLLEGEKKGLGEAYKRGMAKAIELVEPEFIFEMDADLQHSPELLPLMTSLGNYGFDLIIGSRFVLGGSTPNFSCKRRLLSIVGNWMLRVLGGLPSIRDCTSGYRCIRTSVLKQCNLSRLSTKGYSFQSSLLFELLRNNAKTIEVPITFPDRLVGESKLSFSDQWEFLLNIARIRFSNSPEFIKFIAVGASGVVVNLGLYWLLTRIAGLANFLAAPIAIETSILTNFLFNNRFTFRKRETRTSLGYKLLFYHFSAGISGFLNYMTFLGLNYGLGVWDMVANLVGIGIGTFTNYALNSRITWRQRTEKTPFAIDRTEIHIPDDKRK
ncbi:glycosyltransferase family 2 protein [Desulfosarcina sp. OttesenSCG-928-G10]|nr:glycosyltransferase family 2 protein [Desulfosarcina sp. OttesenSCG-928-G10]MDL2321201.1 glycosyltransferase family 2 protein [Desulfosarcina sp. OttesenSCG-928-B08]